MEFHGPTSLEWWKNKVKVIEATNYLIVEDTTNLSDALMLALIRFLTGDYIYSQKSLTIALTDNISADVTNCLAMNGFQFHDEFVYYTQDLEHYQDNKLFFSYQSLQTNSEAYFKSLWSKTMKQSLNAKSSLSIEEHMTSVKEELGYKYKDVCLIAYEKDIPIGIIIPHIEPRTMVEGRLFYFGLLPEQRNKGKSKLLHLDALVKLKGLGATNYVGSTSFNNIPMIKTFQRNNCRLVLRTKVFKRSIRNKA